MTLRRSFLLGRTMGDAVVQEREETVSMLIVRGFVHAPAATRQPGSFSDFIRMRSLMYAGGFHCVRLTGGRSIDRR